MKNDQKKIILNSQFYNIDLSISCVESAKILSQCNCIDMHTFKLMHVKQLSHAIFTRKHTHTEMCTKCKEDT